MVPVVAAASDTNGTASAAALQVSTGNCLDLAHDASLDIGTYECGSGQGLLQDNQQWVLDSTSGLLVSLFPTGGCATALASTR